MEWLRQSVGRPLDANEASKTHDAAGVDAGDWGHHLTTSSEDRSKSQDELQSEFPTGFIEIMRWARICALGLPVSRGHILVALSYFANRHGEMVPGPTLATLERNSRYSRPTIIRALRDLEDWGYLRKEVVRVGYTQRTNFFLNGSTVGWKAPIPDLETPRNSVAELYHGALIELKRENERLKAILHNAGVDPYAGPGAEMADYGD